MSQTDEEDTAELNSFSYLNMSEENHYNLPMSVDDILTWKPPQPTIDIDNIIEIEKFLFGEQITLGSNNAADLGCHDFESYLLDQESFGSDHSALASKLALLAATGHASSGDGNSDEQIAVDAETQARLEALLEAAGIGKLSTSDGKAFADPEVLRRLSSSVSCALDEAAAALSKMKADNENPNESAKERSLVEACSEGDVNTVRKLLFEGRSANETTEDGESLLSLACSAGYYELAEVLLAMHANVEDCGSKGECTPLMEAASGGYLDIVKLLISHGAAIDATSNTGNTALTYACCGGYEDVVSFLVSKGAQLELHNENGHTPLMEAASGGHIEVAAILLKNGAGINTHSNEFKESALTLACYKGHLQMVRFLLQAGAEKEHKTDEMHTALMEASMDGHVEVARLLLDHGALVNMPDDSFESPLTLAACGGHVDLADLLIQRGALLEEVNDEGYTPLMEAAREGHEEMVALLLTKGANVNSKTEETQETALTLACCGGFLECAEVLVSAGADIETGCSTPLMEAAQEGQLDLVKFLIQQGANVNATTQSGDSALSYACEHGHTDVADYLIAAGAELEQETEGGRTPLMKAARAGHLCTVQFLISRGADVNRTTRNNEHCVLSLACVCGHLSVVELLLCQGADPTHKLKDGSTMLLEAAKGGHTPVVQLLLDFPHNFMSIPPENAQVMTPTPEQITPRVPTQSLPMVVPPQEPDQAPDLPLSSGSDHYPADLGHLSGDYDSRLSQDNEKATSQLQALYQQQLQYYQQQNPTGSRNEASFNTAALVTHLIQQGSLLSQASDQLSPDTKLAVDKDVAITVESFLRSMANDAAAGKTRTAESIVEEAQGKLTELEQRIKEAIEKNAQLKSIEMMQTDQLTKEKVEELYKTREEQIHKKQKILEELQKVERELQMKTQQQLKKHYMEMKQDEGTSSHRGKPDGEAVEHALLNDAPDAPNALPVETPQPPPQPKAANKSLTNSHSSAVAVQESQVVVSQPNQPLNNGSSGTFPQPVKEVEDPFCQCVHHPCTQLSHPQAEGSCVDLQHPLPPAPGFAPSAVMPYPQLEIDGHTESNHDTPLTLAAAGGHDDLVQLLICRGANVEHKDKKGFTPLILAATAGHVGVVQSLLEANADIEAQSERTKDTPLSLACSGGRLDVVELLLLRGANKEHRNVSDYTPLSLAASGGYVNIIKLLLSNGAEINSRTGSKLGISPLMLAAMNGHAHAVQLLLDMGADINAQIETNRNTALTLACFQGRHEVVSLLVDRKANVEHRAKTGLTPLMEAASGGYAEVGRVLLDKGADPNAAPVPSSRDTALTIAADKGHYRFCELVLQRGAQVDVRNKKGNTPLWLACNGGHNEVGVLLVKHGADVNASDNRNVTPLMAAFRKAHCTVVRWLSKEVSQFPSDNECLRFIATVSDADQLQRTKTCMESIVQAKDLQAQEANKYASALLEELDMEKSLKEDQKEKAARKRERKRLKRKQKLIKKEEEEDKDDKEDTDAIKQEAENSEESKLSPTLESVTSLTSKLKINDTVFTTTAATTFSMKTTSASVPSSSSAPVTSESSDTAAPKETSSAKAKVPTVRGDERHHVIVDPVQVRTSQKTPEVNKKVQEPVQHHESAAVTSNGDISPRQPVAMKRKPLSTHKPPVTSREILPNTNSVATNDLSPPIIKPSTRSYVSTHGSSNGDNHTATYRSAMTSPHKRPQRRDEGWKEVTTRKYGNTSSGKKMMVSSNLISRVIGRGGCNINAIREVTGAHIDIDKQRKGALERTVTIKGATEAIRHAQQLIVALIKEDRTDSEITDIIAKAQAQAAASQAPVKPAPTRVTMTVVAAPIPSKPAWKVPPSIVSQSTRQSHQPATASVIGGVWVPPATTVPTSIRSSSAVSNKWNLPASSNSAMQTTTAPSVETVKKALFVPPHQQPPAATTAPPSVTFSSKPSDKPVHKPVQPVAPMMSTKVASASTSRISQSSYGPIGSGLPSQQQMYAGMSQTQGPPLSSDQLSSCRAQGIVNPNPLMSNHTSHPVQENMVGPLQSMASGHNMAPQGRLMTSGGQNVPSPNQNTSMNPTATPGHNVPIQNQSFRTPVQASVAPSSRSDGTPISNPQPRASVGITPVHSGSGDGAGGMNSSFAGMRPDGNPVSSPTYSPFSSSFTPNAGSAALWNSESAKVAPYQSQNTANVAGFVEPEPSRSPVDQSKAPGYRATVKSPTAENGIIGGTAITGSANNANMEASSPSASQGSPGADCEATTSKASVPRPIGVERAAYHKRANPASLPLTTVVGNPAANIWSYDKLPPAQIGIRPREPANYANWSAVAPPGRNDGIVTSATSKKPQVTASEISSSPKAPTIEPQPQTPQMPMPPFYPPGVPPGGFGMQNRMPAANNRFSRPSGTGRVGVHPPIGSHLGGSGGVGVVGPQQHQQQSTLQPIGSHLGGAGHLRNSPAYQQGQQMQRTFPNNPIQQQQPGPRYHQVPYFMQQADMQRYGQNVASADMNWQQQQPPLHHHHQQQQQQPPIYNPPSRHPSVVPYQHKEMHNNPAMYGAAPSPYSNNMPNNTINQGAVMQGYSNPVLADTNQSYPVHHDTQAGYVREGEHFYDAGNEYLVRSVVPNNYANPQVDGNSNWDQSVRRPGYQLINGGPDVSSMTGAPQGMEPEPPQGWKEW